MFLFQFNETAFTFITLKKGGARIQTESIEHEAKASIR